MTELEDHFTTPNEISNLGKNQISGSQPGTILPAVPRGHLEMSEGISGCQNQAVAVIFGIGWRPGILLNIPQCTGQLPQQVHSAQTSVLPRLKNLNLLINDSPTNSGLTRHYVPTDTTQREIHCTTYTVFWPKKVKPEPNQFGSANEQGWIWILFSVKGQKVNILAFQVTESLP